ncbi:MAG: SusC/RagA family TonB-linked outer membrane protein [Prevotella sp.]|nr:SusC/RagA family TonB-linked outer membrane protein [Prevotella sp.]MBO6191222.1 SusC/RagA family TonB-linked outer membrane protein [Prevotella sp.]
MITKVKHIIVLSLLAGTCLPSAAQQPSDTTQVNVAFGTQTKEDILGGVSTVNVSDLLKKDYYTSSLGELSSLISGYNGSVWGQEALVLIDGAPRDASYVNPTMIESITVLKSASAVALYGSKGAKGVILITTKRGKAQPLRVDVRANTGLYFAKRYPKYLGAAEYMTLYNEARANDGLAPQYSDAAIYNTAAGTNPYRYPDMNFYSSEFLRKAYNRSDVTAEISGGNDRARYYANMGIQYNSSMVKYGDKKNDDDLNLNVRANVDMKITDWLTGYTNAAMKFENNYSGRGDFWGAAANMRPNWYSPLLPISMMDQNVSSVSSTIKSSKNTVDGEYLLGGNNANQTTVYGDMLKAGYIKSRVRTFLFDVGLKADLNSLLKGLTFSTVFSIDYWNNYNEAWNEGYATYEPVWSQMNGKDVIIGLNKYGLDKPATSEYIGQAFDRQTTTFRAQFDYVNHFDLHNVAATLVGWGYQQQLARDADHSSSDYHRTSNLNLGLRVDYNYAQRYYAELSGTLAHSAKLAEGHRNAFSPSIALGWRLSNENWFKENVSFVDNLKLSAAYSCLNQDIDLNQWYMYQGAYNANGGWYNWQDGSQGGAVPLSTRAANEDMKFIKRKEWRIGLEGSLLNRMISFDFNYFNQLTDGLITDGAATLYPSFFTARGSFLPNTNFNADKRKGFDFDVRFNKKFGEVETSLGFLGMYYTTKADKRDEVWANDYQYRAGHSLSTAWGYECEGFFNSEEEIANHAKQTFGEVRPGDLKYKDQNGDNVIDSKDQIDLGKGTAPFFYGLNLTLKWKNFTFFALATGQAGGIAFKNNSYYCPSGDSKYSVMARERWTPATAATASYPRLTTTDNANNRQTSSFWKYSTNRFDLNKVQVTYDMPQEWFEGKFVKGLSVYLSGESLLTISGERELLETTIGAMPQCRFYNLGVKVNL